MQNDHFPAMMAPMREKYLASLDEKRGELCEFILHCKNEVVNKDHCDALRRWAHHLAVQGKSFGFDQIAHAAHALEVILDVPESPFAEKTLGAESLLHACDAATAANHTVERRPE